MTKKYYHSKSSVEAYIQSAKDVNGQLLIDSLKLFLPEDSTILELGSGPGNDWDILNQDYHVTGSDLSEAFIKHLNTTHLEGQFIKLDAETIDTSEKFDGIFANKVLHHLTDEQLINSIQRQTQVLNPGGVVCLSFWRGSGDEIFNGLFVNYHDHDELHNLFKPHFKVVLIETYTEFEHNDSLLLIAILK